MGSSPSLKFELGNFLKNIRLSYLLMELAHEL